MDMKITGLIKKEGNQYASLCVELDVASCGKSKKEALDGLKRAIETYIEYMVSEGRQKEIYRPVPMDELKEFLFPEDESVEKTFRAVPLNYHYA
jgi:predicted RNase H-like HicB family nuclease